MGARRGVGARCQLCGPEGGNRWVFDLPGFPLPAAVRQTQGLVCFVWGGLCGGEGDIKGFHSTSVKFGLVLGSLGVGKENPVQGEKKSAAPWTEFSV